MGRMLEQIRLVQIEAIVAIDITFCTRGLNHRVKAIMSAFGEGGELEFGY